MFDFFRKKGNNPEEPAKDGGSQNAAGATASGRTTRDALAEFTATPLPDAIDGLLFRVSMADPTDPTSSSGFDAYAARLLSEAEAPNLRAIAVEHPVELRRLNTTGLFWSTAPSRPATAAPFCASSPFSTAWPSFPRSWKATRAPPT